MLLGYLLGAINYQRGGSLGTISTARANRTDVFQYFSHSLISNKMHL